MWGSAGSVADVIGLQSSFDPPDADTERDSIELTETLIRLADQMSAQGMSSERIESLANAFRHGLETRRSRGNPSD
jgi:metal-responsive CopG/Arc/MetJ family transcriptional regulator